MKPREKTFTETTQKAGKLISTLYFLYGIRYLNNFSTTGNTINQACKFKCARRKCK